MLRREVAISLERKVAKASHVELAVLQAALMRALGTHPSSIYTARNARFSSITVLPPEYFDYTKCLGRSATLQKQSHLEAVLKDPLKSSVNDPLLAYPRRLVVDASYDQPRLAIQFNNEELYTEQRDARNSAEEYFGIPIPCPQTKPLLYLGRLASSISEEELGRFTLPTRLIARPLHVYYEDAPEPAFSAYRD